MYPQSKRFWANCFSWMVACRFKVQLALLSWAELQAAPLHSRLLHWASGFLMHWKNWPRLPDVAASSTTCSHRIAATVSASSRGEKLGHGLTVCTVEIRSAPRPKRWFWSLVPFHNAALGKIYCRWFRKILQLMKSLSEASNNHD